MERINVMIPSSTLRKLDSFVQPYKRSQALNYAVLAMLSTDKAVQDAYRNAFSALVKDD